MVNKFENVFTHVGKIRQRDVQTDRQTDTVRRHRPYLWISAAENAVPYRKWSLSHVYLANEGKGTARFIRDKDDDNDGEGPSSSSATEQAWRNDTGWLLLAHAVRRGNMQTTDPSTTVSAVDHLQTVRSRRKQRTCLSKGEFHTRLSGSQPLFKVGEEGVGCSPIPENFLIINGTRPERHFVRTWWTL